MIEIKRIDDDLASAVCERLSLPLCDVLQMCDGEQVLGFCCVACNGEDAVLYHLDAPDTSLTDALLRAALNFALAQGGSFAHIVSEKLQNHMITKGYSDKTVHSEIKIAEFFAKRCCNG